MSSPRLMLIAGIPSAGKSCYGEWLAVPHGFLHIDDVNRSRLRGHGLHLAWEQSLLLRDAHPFIPELQTLDRPAVPSWGVPPMPWPFPACSSALD